MLARIAQLSAWVVGTKCLQTSGTTSLRRGGKNEEEQPPRGSGGGTGSVTAAFVHGDLSPCGGRGSAKRGAETLTHHRSRRVRRCRSCERAAEPDASYCRISRSNCRYRFQRM